MEVADEFLLVAQAGGGRARVRGRASGVAVAGALIGELLFAGKVAVDGDAVWVVDRWPPLDALAHATLDRIAAEPEHRSLRTWLEFLGADATDRVTERLVRAGHLTRSETRRWGRTETRYVPVDPARAAYPQVRLWSAMDRRASFEGVDGFLAGLVLAAGMGWQVFRHAGLGAQDRAAAEAATLPVEQRDLVEQVRVVVSDGVLTHRG